MQLLDTWAACCLRDNFRHLMIFGMNAWSGRLMVFVLLMGILERFSGTNKRDDKFQKIFDNR